MVGNQEAAMSTDAGTAATTFASTADLASARRRAEAYASYMVAEQTGQPLPS